jgi:hypothetical protein
MARPTHGGLARGVVSGCIYATDNGCAAAPANGVFKDATLLTSAEQSGQISFLPAHVPQLNIPGVDYGIGPDSTLTPQDPRTISDGVCSYQGTPPNDFVGCASSGTVVTDTLNNFDFSGSKIGKAAVALYFGGTPAVGSSITVTNSYFSTPSGASSKAIGFSGNWNVLLKNDLCDGATATNPTNTSFCLGDDGLTFGRTLEVDYSVFTNVNAGRVYNGGNSGASRTYKFNFIRGMNDLNTVDHGEVDLMSCGASGGTNCANKTISLFHSEGNFIISNSLSAAYCASGGGANGCTNSATWFFSAGATHGIQYTAVDSINNVIVTNTVGAPGTPVSKHMWGEAQFAIGWASIGTLTDTGNWIDATGSTACTVNGPASGSQSVTASSSGNTLTITAAGGSYANNPIEAGWLVAHAGFTSASITAVILQSGGVGSYTFDGAPQTVGSDSAWTVVPYVHALVSSNNFSLADPSNTGIPQSINPSLPILAAASCPGAHN